MNHVRRHLVSFSGLAFFAFMAIGSGKPDKAGSAETTAAVTESAIGKPVTVGKAVWTVLEATDHGQSMEPTNDWDEKKATTTGRFIHVRYKVENKGKEAGMLGVGPKLVDEKDRAFGTYEDAMSYRPKGADAIVLDQIQPSMSKEFYEIYEVPADAKKLSVKITDFSAFGDTKKVPLGDIPAAAKPAAAAAAAASANTPAAKAAKPAAAPKAAGAVKPVSTGATGATGAAKAKPQP